MKECRPCPVFASFTLAFALQLRKKHGKTSFSKSKDSDYTAKIQQHVTEDQALTRNQNFIRK
jgi:hypothetical protein